MREHCLSTPCTCWLSSGLACARTIKVECVRAQFLEKKAMHSSGPAFDSANFKQANKKDAKFAPTNSTTRAGKSLALAPKNTG